MPLVTPYTVPMKFQVTAFGPNSQAPNTYNVSLATNPGPGGGSMSLTAIDQTTAQALANQMLTAQTITVTLT